MGNNPTAVAASPKGLFVALRHKTANAHLGHPGNLCGQDFGFLRLNLQERLFYSYFHTRINLKSKTYLKYFSGFPIVVSCSQYVSVMIYNFK